MFDPVEESQNANLCADRDVPTGANFNLWQHCENVLTANIILSVLYFEIIKINFEFVLCRQACIA